MSSSGTSLPLLEYSRKAFPTSDRMSIERKTSPQGQCFFFQREAGVRYLIVTGVQTCALPIPPAAAQWLGEPVWNSPKGGTGVTISGDYARPNSDYGSGNTWGGRASLGIGTLTLTAGVARWKPDLATEGFTSIGGNAAFRLIGGSLLPFSVNLQVGAARTDSANSTPALTTVTGAAGFSVPLPTPGVSIEPYFSPGIRYHSSGGANTDRKSVV